ncbi:hypothetical protein CYMTET_48846 [Cymbomonas tetramitiformis]|uniref:ShKT domain-containing protein n=1 Tax=Cymbomonas tetramitiformis TaxID=36881 RepID=A0AAE0EVB3_9CHLO|nr:hypothetical protein CYMTET_48846 [Cymbomonas tetramitiformis]
MGSEEEKTVDNSANPKAVALVLGILAIGLFAYVETQRSSLRSQTEALQNDLKGFSSDKMETELLKRGFSKGGKDPSTFGSADGLSKSIADARERAGEDILAPSANSTDSTSDAKSTPLSSTEFPPNDEQPVSIPLVATPSEAPADAGPADAGAEVNVNSIVPGKCEDTHSDCTGWARNGECISNKDWMLGVPGDASNPGHCLVSCGACQPAKATGMLDTSNPIPDQQSAPAETVGATGAAIAAGPAAAVDNMGAAGAGVTTVATDGTAAAPAEAAAAVVQECKDLSPNCRTWSLHGECERNVEYMIGGDGYEGQCVMSCGKCSDAFAKEIAPLTTAIQDGSALQDPNLSAKVTRVEDRPLKWPQKKTSAGRVCVGLSTATCQRGLHNPAAEILEASDRSIVAGVGGPTGCTEAWGTLLTSNDQIPGALVMIYTLRKLSNVDRDIVVFVTPGVTTDYIKQLLAACVVVKQVTEPMDPSTHMGFVKLTLWLAVEYTTITFVEYDTWFRKDPSDLFQYTAPAAVKTAPHPRLTTELYGSYLFVLNPSRQTFYDMLSKVGTIDSAEVINEQTLYTERLFFSGYFETWTAIPSHMMEFQQDVVSTIVPELTNTRIRRIVKSMPPYTDDTIIDYTLIPAGGIFANLHVKPWMAGWRVPCAWECRYRKFHALYEAVAEEWWYSYYNLLDLPIPSERSLFSLMDSHDPLRLYDKKEYEQCLPFNCEVPDGFHMAGTDLAGTKPGRKKAKKRGLK